MKVIIKLPPRVHDSLLRQLPPGLSVYWALTNAKLIRSYRGQHPLTYKVDCKEDVALTLLGFAKENCPEAVTDIDFALRVARSQEKQHRQ